jgi:hypothetical protein
LVTNAFAMKHSMLVFLAVVSAAPAGKGLDAAESSRWPSCPEVEQQPGTVILRKALLRQGLELGLERLWRRLGQPPAHNTSGTGEEANVLSVLGGALAEMDLNGNLTAAEHLLRLAFTHQRADGYLPWVPTDIANTNWDGHGVLLGFLQLVPLLYRHGHLFSPALVGFLRPRLALGLKASSAQGSHDLWYTNIVIGKITNEIMIGSWLNDSAAVSTGEARLSHWLNFTQDNEGVFIHEYSSTFYFWNDFNALAPAAQYYQHAAPISSGGRTNRLHAVLDQLFAHLGSAYFPPTRTMTGPHSRDYNFLTGKFYIIRGVWGAGIEGITMAFLDSDASSVTAAHLSDLEHAVLYHALITNDGYRPPCSLVALATSPGVREVRSRQSQSSITGDRTVAIFSGPSWGTGSYSVGSVSEDFAAVPGAWCAQSKELNIEIAPPHDWRVADNVWPSITTVVDEHDAPWGLARPVANWSKPTHLNARLGTVQHSSVARSNVTVLLMTEDIDAGQVARWGDTSVHHEDSEIVAAQPPLMCNSSHARHGVGWGGKGLVILDKRPVPPSTALPLALDRCAEACCASPSCTGWAVKPVLSNNSSEPHLGEGATCFLVSQGVQSFHNPLDVSGASGRLPPPSPPGPTPGPPRSSLATNLLFPARAEHITINGKSIAFPDSIGRSGYVLPIEHNETAGNTTLMLVQSGVCFVATVIRADAVGNVSGFSEVEIELKADTDSLERNAARLAIYHYRGAERRLRGSVKVALAFVTGPCAEHDGGPAAFAKAAGRLVGSSVVHAAASDGNTSQWSSELRWDADLWGSHTGAGALELLRDARASASVLRRAIDGVDVVMPEHELEVNGEALSFLPTDGD